jgi:cell division protein FtsB
MPFMQRRHLIGLGLLVVLSFSAVVYTVFISEGWEKRESLKQEVATRNFENDAAQKEVEKLRERIQAIRERPDVQERLVRDKAGFVRPDEVILEMNP